MMLNHLKSTSASSVIKSGKSLGDSIKKHIFNKGLISRSSKKSQTPNNDFNVSYNQLDYDSDSILLNSPIKNNRKIKYVRLS